MNKLQAILLKILSVNPNQSGYDLTKQINNMKWWNASHQQIYRDLISMEKSGLLDKVNVPQSGKPDLTLYSVTEKGFEELCTLTGRGCDKPLLSAIRDDLQWCEFVGGKGGALMTQLIDELSVNDRIGFIRKLVKEYDTYHD